MLFCTLDYILFLPVTVLLFWMLPHKFRLPMLLIASYLFYMSWNSVMVLLIIGLTIFNYFWGFFLDKATDRRKLVFTIGLLTNVACLSYFKYANFFVNSLVSVWRLSGQHINEVVLNIILPLGISFFVFEFIHYQFDIYRGKKPIRSFVMFALFAAFFPTQIAGPIKRYDDFAKQMDEEKKLRLSYFDDGIPLIVFGMAKKLLIANNLAVLVDMMGKSLFAYGALELWLFSIAFAFQLYFDFSGYTDIARGSAQLFGYKIPINFDHPLTADNISDLWRRWHISLSSWLRDYVYVPLGGKSEKPWVPEQAAFLTMVIGGIWHGASWNYVVWGMLLGAGLIGHRLFRKLKKKLPALNPLWESKIYNYVCVLATFLQFAASLVLIRVTDIKTDFMVLKRMLTFSPLLSPGVESGFVLSNPNLPLTITVALILLALAFLQNVFITYLIDKGIFKNWPAPIRASYMVALVVLILIFLPNTSPPFIYFQF